MANIIVITNNELLDYCFTGQKPLSAARGGAELNHLLEFGAESVTRWEETIVEGVREG